MLITIHTATKLLSSIVQINLFNTGELVIDNKK